MLYATINDSLLWMTEVPEPDLVQITQSVSHHQQ